MRPIETLADLNRWLVAELKASASTRRLLILDDLGALGQRAAEHWTGAFVRNLVNQRTMWSVNISIAVGISERSITSFTDSDSFIRSEAYWDPKIEVNWLTDDEVRGLWQQLYTSKATEVTERSINEIITLLKGQPYLTHAALIDKGFWVLLREWCRDHEPETASAIRRSTWYSRHLAAIRSAIHGLEPDATTRLLVRTFFQACLSEAATIGLDERRFLKQAMLIDTPGHPYLDIYRLMAEDLAAESSD